MTEKAKFILQMIKKWLRMVSQSEQAQQRRWRLRAAREFMRDYQKELERQLNKTHP